MSLHGRDVRTPADRAQQNLTQLREKRLRWGISRAASSRCPTMYQAAKWMAMSALLKR